MNETSASDREALLDNLDTSRRLPLNWSVMDDTGKRRALRLYRAIGVELELPLKDRRLRLAQPSQSLGLLTAISREGMQQRAGGAVVSGGMAGVAGAGLDPDSSAWADPRAEAARIVDAITQRFAAIERQVAQDSAPSGAYGALVREVRGAYRAAPAVAQWVAGLSRVQAVEGFVWHELVAGCGPLLPARTTPKHIVIAFETAGWHTMRRRLKCPGGTGRYERRWWPPGYGPDAWESRHSRGQG